MGDLPDISSKGNAELEEESEIDRRQKINAIQLNTDSDEEDDLSEDGVDGKVEGWGKEEEDSESKGELEWAVNFFDDDDVYDAPDKDQSEVEEERWVEIAEGELSVLEKFEVETRAALENDQNELTEFEERKVAEYQ